jgi:hypothetical protein
MDDTVGRTDATFCDFTKAENAYALGLWCADGYHRTSSIGLTNVDISLIMAFRRFLSQYFPPTRIKMRVYWCRRTSHYHYLKKASRPAYQIYVNSRPLLRIFRIARKNLLQCLDEGAIPAYFAGRFDGDGSVSSDNRSDLRIVYGNKKEAECDADLLHKIGITPKVYTYKDAKTFVIYISRLEAEKFLSSIEKYSLRRRK